MLTPTYKGLSLIPTRSAMVEIFDMGFDLYMVSEILEKGYDCQRSPRKKGTLEKCLDRGSKTMKVVVVQSYNHDKEADVWAITHVGMFTKRR